MIAVPSLLGIESVLFFNTITNHGGERHRAKCVFFLCVVGGAFGLLQEGSCFTRGAVYTCMVDCGVVVGSGGVDEQSSRTGGSTAAAVVVRSVDEQLSALMGRVL